MYACYIDESGHCGEKFNPQQPVEVLFGVVTDITKLFKTNREHNGMLKILEDESIPITEVKSANIYRGRGVWHGVKPERRAEFIDQMLHWAVARTCKFIVCPIDSAKFFKRKSKGCEFANLLKFPYEAGAVNVVLALQREKTGKKNNKGKTLIVFDEQGGHDKNLSAIFDLDLSFSDGYTGYKSPPRAKNKPPRLEEVIDIPFFSKSHISPLIQVADLGAFIVNRYLLLTIYGLQESYPNELEVITRWYKILGDNAIKHTNINPPLKTDGLCQFYTSVRPDGWTPKKWFCH